MTAALDARLRSKYPELFPPALPGFACGDGWFPLLDGLGAALTSGQGSPPVVLQVKEKWGGLRVYLEGGGTARHAGMLAVAEELSYRLCEECGATQDTHLWDNGWLRTLCHPCATTHGYDTHPEPDWDEDETYLWGI